MNPTKILNEEHNNILAAIDLLSQECDAMESGTELNKEFIKNAIFFIRNYADKFHHTKEEDILFKILETDEIQEKMPCNPMRQMLHEHDMGRELVKAMEEGIESSDKKKVIENARSYCYLLKDHIHKEDDILYPMADDALSLENKESMAKEFARVEEEMKEVKDKCLSFLGEEE
jgi:hemerythrin-like domain-containing protein